MEEVEKLIKEAAEAKTEGEMWRIVNRERKKWKGINERIGEDEWKEYFMKLLGGVERRVVKGRGGGRGEDEEQELGRTEVLNIVGRMKKGKVVGLDGLPGEVWKFGEEKVEEWMWKFCNKIWKDGRKIGRRE